MSGPDAIIIREEPLADEPTRRTVYHKRTDGRYVSKVQVWRLAADGWHTIGTEVIDELAIDVPDTVAP